MTFSKIATIRELNIDEIEARITEIKIEILKLNIQKAARQTIKPHIFKHKKHELAQLLTIRTQKINT